MIAWSGVGPWRIHTAVFFATTGGEMVVCEIDPRPGGSRRTLTHAGVFPEYKDQATGSWGMILGNRKAAL